MGDMALYTRRFKNELGNDITLQVKDDSLKKVPSVSIYIEGPDSDMEMIVTKAEALEVLEGLYKVLKGRPR
jgi:hypothetical protein